MADLTVKRGKSYTLPVEFLDQDGSPVPLTDTTVSLTVKAAPTPIDLTDATALVAVDQTSHTDPANGQTTIPISIATNAELGIYYFDFQITFLDASTMTTDMLTLEVEPTVTQRTIE